MKIGYLLETYILVQREIEAGNALQRERLGCHPEEIQGNRNGEIEIELPLEVQK